MQVQAELNTLGYGLKLWDGFRPPSAQFKLWEICPDPTYVSNPNNGFSNHSKGNTVDITLVDTRSNELEMPTGFDDFSTMADRNYSDCTSVAAANASLLEEIMEKHGFKGYYGEWWHYTDIDNYDVEREFVP
jgi:D-alanyl-D-alanine dipeptidase